MKTHVLMIARYFMANHPRAGEPTNFAQKIADGEKLHTIRNNYELWRKRIAEVQGDKAILSIRRWAGKPYKSKQEEVLQLSAKDGVGIEKLHAIADFGGAAVYDPEDSQERHGVCVPWSRIAKNDGLKENDFHEWFKGWTEGKAHQKPKALIHFGWRKYVLEAHIQERQRKKIENASISII